MAASHCRCPTGPAELMKTQTIIIKVLDCCRCHSKIKKVLHRIKEKREFVIDVIEYEKNNRVIVKGPFDANRLVDKLCCKAGKIIIEIEIVEPKPTPPVSPKCPKKKKDETQPSCVTVDVDVDVVTPPPQVVNVPYPCPYPYPFPVWPSDCRCHHGHGGCHCCSCGKKEPSTCTPPPAPTPPLTQYIIQQCTQCAPPSYPCGGYKIVCEDDPCSIM